MGNESQRWKWFDYLKVIPAIIVAIVIFYVSSLSNPYTFTPTNFTRIFLNPLLHICEFGTLSFLLLFGLYPRLRAVFLISLSFFYAFLDELHQFFVPYRYFDIIDLLFDLTGILFGYLAYIIYRLIIDGLRKRFEKHEKI